MSSKVVAGKGKLGEEVEKVDRSFRPVNIVHLPCCYRVSALPFSFAYHFYNTLRSRCHYIDHSSGVNIKEFEW